MTSLEQIKILRMSMLSLLLTALLSPSLVRSAPTSLRRKYRELSGDARAKWIVERHAAGELAPGPPVYVGNFANDTVYWWRYNHTDCAYHDIDGKHNNGTIEDFKALCLATKGCSGFNSNGVLKNADCSANKAAEPACDLYLKEDHPEPVPKFAPSVWPLPAAFTNGTATAALSPPAAGGVAFVASGASCPDLINSFQRYTKQTFPHAVRASPEGATLVAVNVANCTTPLQIGVDESYTLEVSQMSVLFSVLNPRAHLSSFILRADSS
jgi:hypothetical protein